MGPSITENCADLMADERTRTVHLRLLPDSIRDWCSPPTRGRGGIGRSLWPATILDERISAEERRDAERHARRNQREFNGIEAQIGVVVVKAGPELWEYALAWGTERRMLAPTEDGVLQGGDESYREDADREAICESGRSKLSASFRRKDTRVSFRPIRESRFGGHPGAFLFLQSDGMPS